MMSNFLLIFVFGAVVGSFLNVLIHRLPLGESIVFPASHCPKCNKRLGALELVPIISFIFLRGKCKSCGALISWRYPLVEFLTGLLFFGVVNFYSPLPIIHYLLPLIFVSMLIVVFFTDLEKQVIHDSMSMGGIILGLLYNYFRGLNFLYSAVLGAALGYALFFLIAKFGRLVFKKDAMGEGDLYLAAMLGAFLGWQGALLAMFLAYLLAGVLAIISLALGKVKMGQEVAFGPALVVGGLVTLFFGSQIISWYINLSFVI
ncbi:MAG: prepilin peptidase [bacterium]